MRWMASQSPGRLSDLDVNSAPEPVRTDPVASADGLAALERLGESGAVQAGSVNLINLDAIRRQLADRWPAKRARVWEHVERDLARRLSAQDHFFRLDEASYLVAMPASPKFMAQACCLAILQDVLKYFIGESRMPDVLVRLVSSVDDGQVTSEAVDPQAIIEAAARAASATTLEEAPPAPLWKPPLAGRTHSASFMTEARRKALVMMGVEGVWNLRRGLVTSFVLERVINPPLSHAADITRGDCAVMAYAADLLEEHRTQGGRLTLHVPVTYAAVQARQSREKVLSVLAPVRDLLRGTILFEICDLDAGVPPSRLIEVVALLKPFCMGVLARVRPTRAALAAVQSCGLQGIVLDATGINREGQELGAVLKAFGDAAIKGAPNVLVHNLAHEGLIGIAGRAGLTHASRKPLMTFETAIDAA